MKLALGTVQFGLDYGISNQSGRPPAAEVGAILALAHRAGINVLDTAVNYGLAEARLGGLGVGEPCAGWSIITKLPGLPLALSADQVVAWCRNEIHQSLARLRAKRVDGLLLHRSQDLLGPLGIDLLLAMRTLKSEGLVGAIGLSVYGPDDLDVLALGPFPFSSLPLDIVQVPCSVLDRRLERSGWADRLVRNGTRVHLRSVFLQGLLLMPPQAVPSKLTGRTRALDAWHRWLSETGDSALAAALRFAVTRSFAERVVVGVTSASELNEIISALERSGPMPPDGLEDAAADLIDPRSWNQSL